MAKGFMPGRDEKVGVSEAGKTIYGGDYFGTGSGLCSDTFDQSRAVSQCWKCGSRDHKDEYAYDVIDCTCRKCGATWRDKRFTLTPDDVRGEYDNGE